MLETFLNRLWGREEDEPEIKTPVLAFTPPPTPTGWTQLPLVSSEFCSYSVESPCAPRPGSLGSESGGVNATEYHGFPPGTLSIGSVGVFMGSTDPAAGLVLRICFDYRPDGWRRQHAAAIPACEFRNLPWRLS